MLSAILYSLLTGAIWAAVGAVLGNAPTDRRKLVTFFAVNSVVYFGVSVFQAQFRQFDYVQMLELAAVLVPASVAELFGFWLLKRAMEAGNQSIAWAVTQSSMVIPFLGGLLLPDAQCGMLSLIGLALLLFGLFLLARDKNTSQQKGQEKTAKKYWIILALAFLLVGISQFLRLLPNYMHLTDVILSWRVTMGAFTGFIIWNGKAVCCREYDFKGAWKTGLLYGLVVLAGQIAVFQAADAAAKIGWSSAVYPTAVGASIILFALYCVFVKKEKVSPAGWLGILLIVFGIAGLSLTRNS